MTLSVRRFEFHLLDISSNWRKVLFVAQQVHTQLYNVYHSGYELNRGTVMLAVSSTRNWNAENDDGLLSPSCIRVFPFCANQWMCIMDRARLIQFHIITNNQELPFFKYTFGLLLEECFPASMILVSETFRNFYCRQIEKISRNLDSECRLSDNIVGHIRFWYIIDCLNIQINNYVPDIYFLIALMPKRWSYLSTSNE